MVLDDQVKEVCNSYEGLQLTRVQSGLNCLKGVISFSVSYQGKEKIDDWFELEIEIPNDYPKKIPSVRETLGKVHSNYEHLLDDGSFCLATPLDIRMTFNSDPTLLGFTNNLVIPYLYGYSYFETYGVHPFDERAHGAKGYIQFYRDLFETNKDDDLISGLSRVAQYGYRGHHLCPCGSGKIIRKCHKELVKKLCDCECKTVLAQELRHIAEVIGT